MPTQKKLHNNRTKHHRKTVRVMKGGYVNSTINLDNDIELIDFIINIGRPGHITDAKIDKVCNTIQTEIISKLSEPKKLKLYAALSYSLYNTPLLLGQIMNIDGWAPEHLKRSPSYKYYIENTCIPFLKKKAKDMTAINIFEGLPKEQFIKFIGEINSIPSKKLGIHNKTFINLDTINEQIDDFNFENELPAGQEYSFNLLSTKPNEIEFRIRIIIVARAPNGTIYFVKSKDGRKFKRDQELILSLDNQKSGSYKCLFYYYDKTTHNIKIYGCNIENAPQFVLDSEIKKEDRVNNKEKRQKQISNWYKYVNIETTPNPHKSSKKNIGWNSTVSKCTEYDTKEDCEKDDSCIYKNNKCITKDDARANTKVYSYWSSPPKSTTSATTMSLG